MVRVASESVWQTSVSPCAMGEAVAAAGGGEKWNRSTLGAQFEEQISSSRNTARDVPSSVTGKSGIVEMFPEGKPLRASGSSGAGATARSAHATQSHPMLAS